MKYECHQKNKRLKGGYDDKASPNDLDEMAE